MPNADDALTISNPRLIAAIYFSLLAVIANIVIDSLLYAMGVQELLPFFQALVLAAAIAAAFGALFGERVIHCPRPYTKTVFWWGFLMVIVAMPFHTFGFLYFFKDTHPHLFNETSLMYYFKMYLLVLFYSFILFGIWLAILGGIAAIYLRGHLIYHMMNALYVRRKPAGKHEEVVGDKTPRYGQATITSKGDNLNTYDHSQDRE